MENTIEYLVRLMPAEEASKLIIFMSDNKNFDIFPNRDQIWTSIIILANFRMDEIEEVIQHARKDWRDVIIAAGLAADDWELVARKFHPM